MTSDEQLILELQKGSDEAFTELFLRYRERVCRAGRGIGPGNLSRRAAGGAKVRAPRYVSSLFIWHRLQHSRGASAQIWSQRNAVGEHTGGRFGSVWNESGKCNLG